MKQFKIVSEITPFGHWIRERCKPKMTVTNLDYVFVDYTQRRIMLLEEKTRGGRLTEWQAKTFSLLSRMIHFGAEKMGDDYWGMYVLRLPVGAEVPCAGMMLNGHEIGEDDLIRHLNFEQKFCTGSR